MRGSSGGGSACSGSWRGTCRWKWPTTARIPTGWRSSIRSDYLPQQYWIPGSLNARDNATQALLTANVTNPYSLSNFAALRTTNPVLYQRMSANGFFTAATVQRNRLLRPFSHINNLTFSNLPLGEVKVHSLQINVNRRFADGFTANAALSFSSSRANRTVEEFDRVPTLWWNDNNSRPFRVSGGAVYELPFGSGRRMLNDGGVWAALAGGWQTGGTFEYQPGSLINFTGNNLFYYGNHRRHQEEQAGDRPEPERHHRCDEVLVQHRQLRKGPDQDADQLPDAGVPVPDRRPAGPGLDLRQPERGAELPARRPTSRSRRGWTCRTS